MPDGIHIGTFTIHFYGIIIMIGAPTNLPRAIFIDPQHRYPGYENIAYYHPLFLYESLWNFMNMSLLLWLSRRFQKHLRRGDIFLIYLIVYPVGRFLLEFLRMDASQVAGFNANQTVMGVVAVVSTILLIARHVHGLSSSSHSAKPEEDSQPESVSQQ